MTSLVRGHFIIAGRVQGVFFRATAREAARSLGLSGWVRNLPDGSVETICEGSAEAVAAYKEWCRRGPPHAEVRYVDERPAHATGVFTSFLAR